ncbi:condensation domain-containing protein [Salinispora arenicola]|uniref:condensation domain-containing protein n=1 Tax=Salinispora arenicola TaxID=168697 RepID=UPI00037F7DE2|nr:condensation domain-containing protein [Salinispora arenicola]
MPCTAQPIPLSATQERLWVLDQLSAEGSYNVALCFELVGTLDMAALRRAVRALTRRHAVLRTCVDDTEGSLAGWLASPEAIEVGIDRIAASGPGEPCETLLYEAALRPFDLFSGPLLRARVVDLPEDVHVVLVVLHHSAIDGLSGPVLTTELWRLYSADVSGTSTELPETAGTYADFARWQRAWLDGPEAADQLAYWAGQLADPPGLLDLSARGPAPGTSPMAGRGLLAFRFPPRAVRGVATAGDQLGATSFMVLLAAFAGALARHTGAEDLIVGTPVTDRPAKECEGVVGPFDNLLLIRLGTRGAPTAGQFVEKVRNAVLDALLHKDVPFQHVVQALAPARGRTAPALYNVAFSVEEKAQDPGPVAGAVVTAHPWIFVPPARFDLTLMIELSGDAMQGRFYFDPERVDETVLGGLADEVVTLAIRFEREPDSPLLPTEAE